MIVVGMWTRQRLYRLAYCTLDAVLPNQLAAAGRIAPIASTQCSRLSIRHSSSIPAAISDQAADAHKHRTINSGKVPVWKSPVQPKHQALIDALPAYIRRNDLPNLEKCVQALMADKVLAQVPSMLNQRIFDTLYNNESPLLDEYLSCFKQYDGRFSSTATYVRMIHYYIATKRTSIAANLYRKFRGVIVTSTHHGAAILSGQLLYMECRAVPRGTVSMLFEDFLKMPSDRRDRLLEPLLLRLAEVQTAELADCIRQAMAIGYAPPLDAQEMFFAGMVDQLSDLELPLTLYTNLRAAGRTPSAEASSNLIVAMLNARDNSTPGLDVSAMLASSVELMEEMLAHNETPTKLCLGRIITTYSTLGMHDKVEHYFCLFEQRGLLGALVYMGYASSLCQTGRLERAEEILYKTIDSTFVPQPGGGYAGPDGELLCMVCANPTSWYVDSNELARLFAPLVHRYADAGYGTEGALIDDAATAMPDSDLYVRSKKDKPTGPQRVFILYPVVRVVLHLLCMYRQQQRYRQIERMLLALLQRGFAFPLMLDLALWNHFDQQRWSCILELCRFMERLEMPPSAAMHQLAMLAHIHTKQMDEAKRYLLDMLRDTQSGVMKYDDELHKPELNVNRLAVAYAELGDVAAIKELLEASKIYQVPITTHLPDALLQACMRPIGTKISIVHDRLEEAYAYIKQHQLPLFESAFVRVITHYTEQKNLAGVERWYQRGVEAGYGSHLILQAATIKGLAHAGEGKRALALYEQMRQQPDFRMDEALLAVLCDLAGFHLSRKQLHRFWREAEQDGITYNENNYAAFAEAAWRLGDYQLAAQVLLDWMPKAGHRPNLLILIALYHTTCKRRAMQAMQKRILKVLRDVYQLHPDDPDVEERIAAFSIEVAALKVSQAELK